MSVPLNFLRGGVTVLLLLLLECDELLFELLDFSIFDDFTGDSSVKSTTTGADLQNKQEEKIDKMYD